MPENVTFTITDMELLIIFTYYKAERDVSGHAVSRRTVSQNSFAKKRLH